MWAHLQLWFFISAIVNYEQHVPEQLRAQAAVTKLDTTFAWTDLLFFEIVKLLFPHCIHLNCKNAVEQYH